MGELRIGGRNNVLLTGRADKPVMMLANGFGCDQNMWRLVGPGMAEDFRVVLFDHVGSGRAEPSAWQPERYATLDGYVEDILRICHELELNDVVFVGHSVSAMMGVLAAIAEPERFRKLILIGPSPRYIDDAGYRGGFSESDIDELLESLESNYLGWSAAMAPVIMGNPDRPELGQEHVPVGQPGRSGPGHGAHADPAMLQRRDRAARGRSVRARPDPGQHPGHAARYRSLPAAECPGRH
jgi:sigma-B regulation protein RsbQ